MYKNYFLTAIFLSFFVSCNVYMKSDATHVNKNTENSIKYDSVKTIKYGADDYGMKKYVMAFLKKGPNRSKNSVEASKLQKAHLENIIKMADAGKLILAGPFLDNDSIRGIYIFNVPSIEEARQLTESDPAVEAGSLIMELREWYGSAALMEVNNIHKTLEKKSITE